MTARDLGCATRNEFARACNVSGATVSRWLKEGLPAENSGRKGSPVRIDVRGAIGWLFRRGEHELSARERLAAAQADAVQLRNKRTKSQLVLATQVRAIANGMKRDLAARLEVLPNKVADDIAGMTEAGAIRELLLDECRSIRAGHAEYIEKLADGPPPSE